jgi:hypothetical protein
MKRNAGLLLLGIWLVIHGLMQLVSFHFAGLGTAMAVLALLAGGLIILGR